MPLFWFIATASAECTETITIERFNQLLTDAEAAYAGMDDNFPQTLDATLTLMACIEDIIPSETAARIHRAVGLQQFLTGQKGRAEQAFASARTIETFYEFPEDLVPSTSPVRTAYTNLSIDAPKTTPLPAPKEGNIRMNGEISLARPDGWPTLFQYIDATGHILATAYVWPGDAPPEYPHIVEGEDEPTGGIPPLALVSGSVSAGLLGAGLALWGSQWSDFNAYCDPVLYNAEWCDSISGRIWIGNALVGVGAAGLAATGVWVVLSPGGISLGGSF
jgi:hypothetical protein